MTELAGQEAAVRAAVTQWSHKMEKKSECSCVLFVCLFHYDPRVGNGVSIWETRTV